MFHISKGTIVRTVSIVLLALILPYVALLLGRSVTLFGLLGASCGRISALDAYSASFANTLLMGFSTERASDLARRASEPAGMAFEIAFKTAGRLSVPSERALEPYERALKPRGGSAWSQLGSG